jgi:hypothetical protein
LTSLALFLVLQKPVLALRNGDSWTAARSVRYVSKAAEIDMQDDDKFTYRVDKDKDALRVLVSRLQVGTKLNSGVYVPAPPGGEPEEWAMPVKDGVITIGDRPVGKLETLLCGLVVAAWNGSSTDKFISVKRLDATHEELAYDEKPIEGKTRIAGTVTLDPKTHSPLEIHLLGTQVQMPGGSDWVSIRVDYLAKKGS